MKNKQILKPFSLFKMADLETKIKAEARPDSTIIACRFPFPTLPPIKTIDAGIDSVWVYRSGGKDVTHSI